MNEIQKLVQDVRDKHSLNQRELAGLVGVTEAAVSYWVSGKRPNPGRDQWIALEGLLKAGKRKVQQQLKET